MTVGTLLHVHGVSARFFEPVYRLSEQLNVLQRRFCSGERVFALMEEEAQVQDAVVLHRLADCKPA